MKTTRAALAALAAVGALTLAACTAEPGAGEDTGGGDTGADSGDNGDSGDEGGDGGGDSIRIGIKFDQPGLGYKDGDTFTGFDVDVATYIADQLGYSEDQIEWVEPPSPQRETMVPNEENGRASCSETEGG